MLAHQGNEGSIATPDDILHWRSVELCNGLLLLYIIQDNRRSGAEDEAGSTAIEDLVRLNGRFDGLDNSIGEVAYFDKLGTYQRKPADKGEKGRPAMPYSKPRTCSSRQRLRFDLGPSFRPR